MLRLKAVLYFILKHQIIVFFFFKIQMFLDDSYYLNFAEAQIIKWPLAHP